MQIAIGHRRCVADFSAPPFLAADAGDTRARVACVRIAHHSTLGFDVLAYREFACADFPCLAQLLRTFIVREVHSVVRSCVLACAGQPSDDAAFNGNLAWPVHLGRLRQTLAFDSVAVIKEVEALAIKLGIGLGAALHLCIRGTDLVLPTQAGYTDFASVSPLERDVVARRSPAGAHVAYERIVSGPGLSLLYVALCNLGGGASRLTNPEDVTAVAVAEDGARAVQAFRVFAAALGSFTGGLAMTFMTSGGVYLAGGVLSEVFGSLQQSSFAARFLHANSVRTSLARVLVRVIKEHGWCSVLGAATWYARHGAGGAPVVRNVAAV